MCGRRSELSSLSYVSRAIASHGALCNIAKALEHCVSSACRVCTPPRASGRARCPATRRWTLPKRGVGNAQSRVRSQASAACGVACTSVHGMLSALIGRLLCHKSPCSGICSPLWRQSGSWRFASCSQLGTNTKIKNTLLACAGSNISVLTSAVALLSQAGRTRSGSSAAACTRSSPSPPCGK